MSHEAWLRVLFKNVKSELKPGTDGCFAHGTHAQYCLVLLISQSTSGWAALQSRCLFGSGFGSLGKCKSLTPTSAEDALAEGQPRARDRGPRARLTLFTGDLLQHEVHKFL